MRRKWTSQKGASAVEFALLLPLLMLIIWGSIEFSLLMYNKQVITNASREAARSGIIVQYPNRVTDSEIIQVAQDYCASYLISFGGTGLNIPTPQRPQGTSFGKPLIVTVNYNYQFLVFQGIANAFFSGSYGSIPLSAVTVMRFE